MCQKLVYQRQNWPSPCIWRDLYLCHLSKVFIKVLNVHPHKLICLFTITELTITKVTGVSFGTSKDHML